MRTTRLLACSLLLLAGSAWADIWMADENAIHKLDATATQVELSLVSTRPKTLAVDPRDGAIWILTEKRIARRSRVGEVQFDIDLKTLGLESADLLAVDPGDGSAWIGDGKGLGKGDGKHFLRLDAGGRAVGALPSPGEPRALSIALDGSIWILGK